MPGSTDVSRIHPISGLCNSPQEDCSKASESSKVDQQHLNARNLERKSIKPANIASTKKGDFNKRSNPESVLNRQWFRDQHQIDTECGLERLQTNNPPSGRYEVERNCNISYSSTSGAPKANTNCCRDNNPTHTVMQLKNSDVSADAENHNHYHKLQGKKCTDYTHLKEVFAGDDKCRKETSIEERVYELTALSLNTVCDRTLTQKK